MSRFRRLALLILFIALAFATLPSVLAAGAAPSSSPTAPTAVAPPAVAATDEKANLSAIADEAAREVETLRGWKFKQPVRKQVVTVQQALSSSKRSA